MEDLFEWVRLVRAVSEKGACSREWMAQSDHPGAPAMMLAVMRKSDDRPMGVASWYLRRASSARQSPSGQDGDEHTQRVAGCRHGCPVVAPAN